MSLWGNYQGERWSQDRTRCGMQARAHSWCIDALVLDTFYDSNVAVLYCRFYLRVCVL